MEKVQKPLLILFRGYPGTGKSYLSKQLSLQMELPIIIRDKFKTLLHKHNYSDNHVGKKSYEMMWEMAEKYLKSHNSCICDTNLVQSIEADKIEFIKNQNQADVLIIECYCLNETEHKRRLKKRELYPSYYAVNSYKEYKNFVKVNSKYKNYTFPYPTIQIDTSKDMNIERFKDYIFKIVKSKTSGVFKYNF